MEGIGVRRWRLLPGTAVAAALLAVAGCSSDTPGSNDSPSPTVSASPSSPTASPSPTALAIDPAVESEVLAAYRGYWKTRVAAHADPSEGIPTNLSEYAVDKAAADLASSVMLFDEQGMELRGEPVLSPTVTEVTSGDPATASITDCVDSTDWTPVFTATGKSALPPGQPMRVVVESTASTYDGRWVIRTSTAFRDRKC